MTGPFSAFPRTRRLSNIVSAKYSNTAWEEVKRRLDERSYGYLLLGWFDGRRSSSGYAACVDLSAIFSCSGLHSSVPESCWHGGYPTSRLAMRKTLRSSVCILKQPRASTRVNSSAGLSLFIGIDTSTSGPVSPLSRQLEKT